MKIIKTYNVRNFLQLICLDHCGAEKLFSENVPKAIVNSGGKITLPNELKAGRSVIVMSNIRLDKHRLDKMILSSSNLYLCLPLLELLGALLVLGSFVTSERAVVDVAARAGVARLTNVTTTKKKQKKLKKKT